MRWLAPLILVAAVVSANAAPLVEIKAQTRVALDRVKLRGDDNEVEVRGILVDKLTNEGISGQTVTVLMGGKSATATTGQDGRFVTTFDVIPGPQPVELRFNGAHLLDKADPLVAVVDPSRAQVTLTVRSEPAKGGVTLHITGLVEDRATPLEVKVSVGDAAATELKQIAKTMSGKPYLLTRADAGGPGARRVRVTFSGDATRQVANAETTFDLNSATTTTLELADKTLAFEDDVSVSGKVVDEDGKPVARAAVALVAGDRRLAQSATEDDGSYKFKVEAEVVAGNQQLPRDFGLQVQAEPISQYYRPSRSNPSVLGIAAPQPVPVSYTVAAFIATALAAGGFFTARAKPWKRFQKAAPPSEARPEGEVPELLAGGLVANKPGIVSTLRRPYDDGFSGVVRDTVRGRPVPDAIVRIVFGEQEREVRTAADGTFAIEKLPIAEWKAEVAAPGHVTERFSVSIPHRGELRGVRVDLVPVREKVFQLYRRAAEPALPEARLWGIWSPRQIVDHVKARRQSPALTELTDFVEEVYFSPRMASETVLPLASERVDRAIRERARV